MFLALTEEFFDITLNVENKTINKLSIISNIKSSIVAEQNTCCQSATGNAFNNNDVDVKKRIWLVFPFFFML